MGVEIKVEGLTKRFGSQVIWNDVSLTLPAGEISVMLGPSGTGKSVFLKTLVGLLKPDARLDLDPGPRPDQAQGDATSTRSASCSACCSRTARCSAR